MGDQTFAGTQPECFLFGDNNDLNFLSHRPVAVTNKLLKKLFVKYCLKFIQLIQQFVCLSKC